MWRIYDYITRHFIATVSVSFIHSFVRPSVHPSMHQSLPVSCWFQISPDCKYLQTTVTFEIGNEVFSAVGKRLISPGFTSVMTWQAIPNDESIPACTEGEECAIDEVMTLRSCFRKSNFAVIPASKSHPSNRRTLWLSAWMVQSNSRKNAPLCLVFEGKVASCTRVKR